MHSNYSYPIYERLRAAAPPAVEVLGYNFVRQLGAKGVINRKNFNCWGQLPKVNTPEYNTWMKEMRKFGKAIWDITGKGNNVDIVFEHPGEATFPVSTFVCKKGGMVVICAGTTGYSASVDLRYHWVRQKRLQGSHGSNDEQARAYNQLVYDGKIDPCRGEVYTFDQIGQAHYDMEQGEHVIGNRVALVGAKEPGLGRK